MTTLRFLRLELATTAPSNGLKERPSRNSVTEVSPIREPGQASDEFAQVRQASEWCERTSSEQQSVGERPRRGKDRDRNANHR